MLYVFRTLVGRDLPLNDGCLEPLTITPINAPKPADRNAKDRASTACPCFAMGCPSKVVATEDGRPLLAYGTDSPLRGTEGDLEVMALYAGQSAAFVDTIASAAEVVARMMTEAERAVARLTRLSQTTGQPA